MSKEKMLAMQKQVTGKLMAAISMLLVSAILMCLTSYAWFILSTAPEVSNLKTTAGANGALEIALQSTNKDGTGRADITSAVGSSHAKNSATVSNTYWGNVVDLTEGYGLDNIQLYPSRLKTKATTVNGKTSYSVDTGTILQVPQFGQDGRVSGLLNATKTHYENGQFVTGANWGVNVLGAVNPDNKAEDNTITLTYRRDTVLKQAREKVAAYRAELRSDMTNLIERNSMGIMGWMISLLPEYTGILDDETRYLTMKDYVASMDAVVTEATDAVRWALLANAVADEEHYKSNSDADMKALGAIYAEYAQMKLTGENSVQSLAESNGYDEVKEAAIAIAMTQTCVDMAKNEINDETMDIGNAGLMLVSPSQTVMHGSKGESGVEFVQFALPYDINHFVDRETIYTYNDNPNGIEKANLFSALAAVLGDYTGDMTVWFSLINGSMVGTEPADPENWMKWVYTVQSTCGPSYDAWKNVDDLDSVGKQADGTYAADANVGTLAVVLNQIEGIEAPGVIQVEVKRPNVTAYGYSVDLAFKSSEATNLLLQQTGISRVSGDGEDPDLKGSGSTVQFTVAGDMTEEQVKDLLQGVYIVFMNTGTGSIYKVAAVDPDSVAVKLLPYPATATATLALYEPAFDEAGNLSLGRKITGDNQAIMALAADKEYYISAVVYLNGDAVDTTAFSASQELSMTGAMNLQFASSATLTPMEYSDYKRKE